MIIKSTRAVPNDLEAEFGPVVEHALVDLARRVHPGQVEKAALMLLDRLNPDGREPNDDDQVRRGFGLRKKADGGSSLYGEFTPELTALVETVFDSLAAPEPAEDGTPDPRTADQRRHDALLDATTRLMRSDLPHTGGAPVTLLVIMRIEDFLTGTGTAETSHGDLIAVREILNQAADTAVIPVVLSDTGGILAYGRARRLASCEQRRALAARDRGCSFPGLHPAAGLVPSPPVIAYADGGPTALDNLTLLCGYHHRHFEALGWNCHINDGIPLWTPPAWLDPDRQPRRNTAHHLEIDFDTG